LIFDYTNSGIKITSLEKFVGKSGYMIGNVLSITTFDEEEIIQLFAVTDEQTILDKQLCERFFSLPANIIEQQHEAPPTLTKLLFDAIALQQTNAIDEVGQRNANYFETELDKLDNWGEDRRNSLKVVLKELDQQIKEVKKQARLAPNLPDKLKLEKERKKLEAERDTAWKEYDGAAKEIEQNKDQLIDKVEKRLKQNLKDEQLFNFKWTLI